MEFLNDLAFDLVAGLAYGVVGLVLMIVGYKVVDLLTPQDLGSLLVTRRRRDAGVIVGAAMLGIGLIVSAAILASAGDHAPSLLPLPAAWARRLILLATLLCAICGFVYELVIVAMGTVLLGSGTAQTAMVLGTFVAAMGVGSWLATQLPRGRSVESFIVIEAIVALLGGLSAMA